MMESKYIYVVVFAEDEQTAGADHRPRTSTQLEYAEGHRLYVTPRYRQFATTSGNSSRKKFLENLVACSYAFSKPCRPP